MTRRLSIRKREINDYYAREAVEGFSATGSHSTRAGNAVRPIFIYNYRIAREDT